jgi:hypothetical protein
VFVAIMIMINRHSGTLKQEIHDFIPSDLTAIDRLVIARKNQQIILDKTKDSWELESYGKARSPVIDFFFTSLQRLEIVAPASKADRSRIRENLLDSGRVVSFYHHGKVIRRFYAGYSSLTVPGTYMMDARRKFPYRIKLKGFDEVNLENLFSINAETWKQNILFGFHAEDIDNVAVKYPKEPLRSFGIYRNAGGEYKVTGQIQRTDSGRYDRQEILDYLNYFGGVAYIHAGHPLKQKMETDHEFAEISVRLRNGSETHVRAYSCFTGPNHLGADKDQFIAIIEPITDTVLIKFSDMDPIFHTWDDFQKK